MVSENKTLQRLLADLFESNNGQVADKAQWHDASLTIRTKLDHSPG
jgi:hypothetical protein